MTPSLFFLLINIISGMGWLLLLAISPFWKKADQYLMGLIIMLLSCVYAWLNFCYIGDSGGMMGFFSLEGVEEIFSNPYLIDAAWAHLVAFDLVVALWIKKDAAKNGFTYWIILPVLLITCIFGPLGFIVYQIMRWVKSGRYFYDLDIV